MSKTYQKLYQKYGPPTEPGPLQVTVWKNDVDSAIKKFKIMVQKEKILADWKENFRYEKPSEKKRRKHIEAEQRRLAAEAKQKQIESGEWTKKMNKKQKK